jgi:hypothetical protein
MLSTFISASWYPNLNIEVTGSPSFIGVPLRVNVKLSMSCGVISAPCVWLSDDAVVSELIVKSAEPVSEVFLELHDIKVAPTIKTKNVLTHIFEILLFNILISP